jgi:hypothetical protein
MVLTMEVLTNGLYLLRTMYIGLCRLYTISLVMRGSTLLTLMSITVIRCNYNISSIFSILRICQNQSLHMRSSNDSDLRNVTEVGLRCRSNINLDNLT